MSPSPRKPARRPGADPAPAPREASATPSIALDEAAMKELVGYQLAQASIVTIEVFEEQVGRPHDLKTVEYTMLALIQANPGVSPAQLRKALCLSAAYVTAGLDKLHTRGFILREVNQQDRRGQHLRITKAAERLVSELTQILIAAERARFRTLTSAEQRMLAELLHKLALAR
jgi:DNA-binding MarR family transcriptional regulator